MLQRLMRRLPFREPGPKVLDLTARTIVAPTLTERRIFCTAEEKDVYLYYFLMRYPGRTLVFVNSIQALKRLLPILQLLQVAAYGLHAQMQQRQRLKNLDRCDAGLHRTACAAPC